MPASRNLPFMMLHSLTRDFPLRDVAQLESQRILLGIGYLRGIHRSMSMSHPKMVQLCRDEVDQRSSGGNLGFRQLRLVHLRPNRVPPQNSATRFHHVMREANQAEDFSQILTGISMTLSINVDQPHVTLVCRLVDRPEAVGVEPAKP
jgi:hypothetical protein